MHCRQQGNPGCDLFRQKKGNGTHGSFYAGIIPVKAEGNRWTLQANAPTWRECDVSRDTLATMLGINAQYERQTGQGCSYYRPQL